MRKKAIYIIIFAALFCDTGLRAQYSDHRNRQVDSLEQVLQTNNQLSDTKLIVIYEDLAWGYLYTDGKKSMEYARKGVDASKRVKSVYRETGFYIHIGLLHYGDVRYDSAMIYYEKALQGAELMRTVKNPFGEPYKDSLIDNMYSRIYGSMANLYNMQGKYHEAIAYYTKALEIFKKHGWKGSELFAYDNIGVLYRSMDNYEQAEIYHRKAEKIAHEINDSLMIASVQLSLSELYILNHKDYGKALEYAETAYGYYFNHPEEGDKKAYTLNVLADIYLNGYNDDTRAEAYIRQALVLADEFDIPREKSISLTMLSTVHLKRGQWRQARQAALEGLAADDTEPANTLSLYVVLAKACSYLGNAAEAGEYIDKMQELQASWSTKHYQSAIREMEVKYETEKKETRIATLEGERRLIMWLGIVVGVVLLLAATLLLFLWRWTVQKRRLAEQQVKQLEQEKQLIATQAVLDGEVQERTRLARDLHDGLGSMLTGAKLGFVEMKQNAKLNHADLERFDKALGALDKSMHEMRRVAHHLMPDSLSRFGLKPAVEDFCSNLPTVEFIYYGDESRLEPKLEAMIYRCIHELVNNALKHAGASQIIVQIMQRPDSIAFTVQDDGCGFDPSAASKGMGLANIHTRVASYNGILNIDSKTDAGTEINVELRVEN